MSEKQVNEYKGFSLFNDVEDTALRTFNRARILVNIAEDYTNKHKRISAGGAGLIIGYFNQVPLAERTVVKNKFAELMQGNGYALTA